MYIHIIHDIAREICGRGSVGEWFPLSPPSHLHPHVADHVPGRNLGGSIHGWDGGGHGDQDFY